jgi:foldase protein PrsA
MQDILFRVRVNTIFTKLVARHTKQVTPAAISAYYASHSTQFGKPETRDFRIVRTNSLAQANAAKAALQHGKSWQTVTHTYSIDPTTKKTGGLLTGVTAGQQDAALSKAAFAASPNKLVGPVKGQFGYYVIEVIKVTPATHRSLAQSTALIKQTLQTQLTTRAQQAVDAQAKKNWLSKTKCKAVYAMADCAGYKAPKTSASSSTTGAG